MEIDIFLAWFGFKTRARGDKSYGARERERERFVIEIYRDFSGQVRSQHLCQVDKEVFSGEQEVGDDEEEA